MTDGPAGGDDPAHDASGGADSIDTSDDGRGEPDDAASDTPDAASGPSDAASDTSGDATDESDVGVERAELTLDDVYDAIEAAGRPVVDAATVARATNRTQAEAADALEALADAGELGRVTTEATAYYPESWGALADRERLVVFPDRREIVADQPTQFTRARLASFAHLVDSTGTEPGTRGYLYEIRPEDVWAAPVERFAELLSRVRSVLPRRVPALEEWLDDQWSRANQFRLSTHPDGYTVLEADRESLMGNVARQKLADDDLRAAISDTESWVNDDRIGAIKRTLYEAGYPVIDDRELESGEPLAVRLTADLRAYQERWVDRFLESGAGVLTAPPGSGKTVAAIGVLAAVGGETLILCPSRELVGQWRSELLAHTDLTDDQIGEYHGGRKQIRPVTIATYQTAGMDRHRSLFDSREWGLITYDECFAADTTIETRSGRRTFAELDDRYELSDGWTTDTDLSVKTYNPETDQFEFTRVTGIYKSEAPVQEIETSLGQTIEATPTHTHLVFDPETCEITDQRGISEGDFLVRPSPSPQVESTGDPAGELLGWFLGDGHMNEYGDVKFSFGSHVTEQVSIIRQLCSALDLDSTTFENDRGDVTIRIPKLRQQLDWNAFASDKSRTVRVPAECYTWDTGRVAALLRGLFDAEGSVDQQGRIEFDTVSEGLATDVSRLLQRFGLPVTTHHISREDSNHAPVHRLYLPSFYRETFRDQIGFRLPHKATRDESGNSPAMGVPVGGYLERLKSALGTSNRGLANLTGVSRQTIGDVIRGKYRLGQHHLRSLEAELRAYAAGERGIREATARRERHDITYDELASAAQKPVSTTHRTLQSSTAVQATLDETIQEKRAVAAEHADRLGSVAGLDLIEVTNVESAGCEQVYDFETETHTFVADGLLTHNCHHIPSDVFRRSSQLQSRHRLGLSASPVREDDAEEEIFTLIGPPLGTDWGALFDAGYVLEPEVEIRYVEWDDTAHDEWMAAEGRDRRRLAAENPAKLETIRALREEYPEARTLIFVEYLDQGERLSEALGVPFVSGETRHHVRERYFEEFRQGDRQELIVSRIADEGLDLPNAELAIVASGLGGSRRQGTQRAGRTMRPGGSAQVYVLATRGTSEEEFARRRMQHLSEKGIRVREQTDG